MFFLRKLEETGHHLGPVLVNQIHPDPGPKGRLDPGLALLRFMADRDRRGLALLRSLLPAAQELIPVALEPVPPGDLRTLGRLVTLVAKTKSL